MNDFTHIVARVDKAFHYAYSDLLPALIVLAGFFIGGYFLCYFIGGIFIQFRFSRRVITLVSLITLIVSIVSGIALAIQILGFDFLASLITFGIASLGVGYAISDHLSNIFAGVNIQFCSRIEIGKYISVGGYNGFIHDFTLHYVTIRDEKNNLLHEVPNSIVLGQIRTFYMLEFKSVAHH